MLPQNGKLADLMMDARFISKWDHTYPYKRRYCKGACDLYDTGSEHTFDWIATLSDDRLQVSIRCLSWTDDVPSHIALNHTVPIESFDFCFNVQMYPIVVFTETTGIIRLYNWVSESETYELRRLPDSTFRPKLCLDYPDPEFSDLNDVLLTWTEGSKLITATQRSNFLSTTEQCDDPILATKYVYKFDMTDLGRIGWRLKDLNDY